MLLKFEDNETIYYMSMENISALCVNYLGGEYVITLWDKQEADFVIAKYSSEELCDRAIRYVYKQKFLALPNQIIKMPKEEELEWTEYNQ